MIKLLKISDEKRKKIESWASDEMSQALIDRSGMEDKWKLWQSNFEAKPETEQKNFPFEKCSNLVIPIQSITCNSYVARQYNTIVRVEPPWTVTSLSDKWTDHAKPTQDLLSYTWKFKLRMLELMIPWMYDTANMGTGFFKLPWVSEVIGDKRYSDDGSIINVDILEEGPRFIPISIEDLLFQVNSIQDLQLTQWIAHRFRLHWFEIERRSEKIKETGEPIYINTKELESFFAQQATNLTEKAEEVEKLTRSLLVREHELYEMWADYDYDDDKETEKVCFTFHNKSGQPNKVDATLIRAILNPYDHRLRPIFHAQGFPRAHRIYGIGFGQKLERLQQGLTTQANQAIDNASIANAKVIKYKRGSGIKPPFKIWAGKMIPVSDMSDMESMSLGDIYPSTNMIIQFLKDISLTDTGASDYLMGRESTSVGSGATATSTLALIQEGTKIFDFLLSITRIPLNKAAYVTHSMYTQFKPVGTLYYVLGEDGKYVEETWKAPKEQVKDQMLFELTASSAYVNQAIERQSWMDLFNLIMGYYMKLFQASEALLDPQAPPQLKAFVVKLIESGQLIMERIIRDWNVKDVKRVLADVSDLIQLAQVRQPPAQPSEEEQMRKEKERQGVKGQQIDNVSKMQDLLTKGREGVPGVSGGRRR